jgi:hypothetical protein
LNGQPGLFVARISGLAEEAKGWQAFFSLFFNFFQAAQPGVDLIISDRD